MIPKPNYPTRGTIMQNNIQLELQNLYEANRKQGMNEDDAYTEAYAVLTNKYDDVTLDHALDGRNT